jgi:hypothetical protein
MVYLLNREISVDVDLSTAGCGINVAFFFVGMEADGGKEICILFICNDMNN